MKKSKLDIDTIYYNDVKTFDKFINNLQIIDYSIFDEKDFWHLLLLLSRGYLNDNFHKIFDMVNEIYLEQVIFCSVTIDDFYDNTFLYNNYEILNILINKQHFKIDPYISDYKKIFRIIRNHLSHYNYKYEKDLITFEEKEDNITISFSVSTLVLLLLATLSNVGQSNKIEAYENFILDLQYNTVDIKAINNVNQNIMTPLELIRSEELVQYINCIANYTRELCDLPEEEKEVVFIEILRTLLSDYGKQHGYIFNIDFLDSNVIDSIYKAWKKNPQMGDVDIFKNIYNMLKDNIKCSTISYKIFVDLLYRMCISKSKIDDYDSYMPILKNLIIINYLNIVFCDYAIKRNTSLSNEFFEYLEPISCDKIPSKIRNSLAHCHYKLDDMLEESSDIIIEFWDEKKNVINFKCKIKKNKVNSLIENYIKFIVKK